MSTPRDGGPRSAGWATSPRSPVDGPGASSADRNNSARLRVGSPLLDWVNSVLQLNLNSLQQLGTGAAMAQLMDAFFPNAVAIARVNFAASKPHETLSNWKVFQAALAASPLKQRDIDVPRLSKGSLSENLELLQWLHRQLAGLEPFPDYDPASRRAAAARPPPDDGLPLPADCQPHPFKPLARQPGSAPVSRTAYTITSRGPIDTSHVTSKWRAGLAPPCVTVKRRTFSPVPYVSAGARSWSPGLYNPGPSTSSAGGRGRAGGSALWSPRSPGPKPAKQTDSAPPSAAPGTRNPGSSPTQSRRLQVHMRRSASDTVAASSPAQSSLVAGDGDGGTSGGNTPRSGVAPTVSRVTEQRAASPPVQLTTVRTRAGPVPTLVSKGRAPSSHGSGAATPTLMQRTSTLSGDTGPHTPTTQAAPQHSPGYSTVAGVATPSPPEVRARGGAGGEVVTPPSGHPVSGQPTTSGSPAGSQGLALQRGFDPGTLSEATSHAMPKAASVTQRHDVLGGQRPQAPHLHRGGSNASSLSGPDEQEAYGSEQVAAEELPAWVMEARTAAGVPTAHTTLAPAPDRAGVGPPPPGASTRAGLTAASGGTGGVKAMNLDACFSDTSLSDPDTPDAYGAVDGTKSASRDAPPAWVLEARAASHSDASKAFAPHPVARQAAAALAQQPQRPQPVQRHPGGAASAQSAARLGHADSISTLSEPDIQERYDADAGGAADAAVENVPPGWVLEARTAAEKGQAPIAGTRGAPAAPTHDHATARSVQGAVAMPNSPSGRASPLQGRGSTRIGLRASNSSVLSEPDTQEHYGADAAKHAGRRDAPPDWVLEARAAEEKGQAPAASSRGAPAALNHSNATAASAQGSVVLPKSGSGRASPLRGRGSTRIDVRTSGSSVLSEPDTQEQYGAADAAKRTGRRDAPPDWVLEARAAAEKGPGPPASAQGSVVLPKSGSGRASPLRGRGSTRIDVRTSGSSVLSEPDTQEQYGAADAAKRTGRRDAPPDWVLEARAAAEKGPGPPASAQGSVVLPKSGSGRASPLRGRGSTRIDVRASGSSVLSEPDTQEQYGAADAAKRTGRRDAPPDWVLEARAAAEKGPGPPASAQGSVVLPKSASGRASPLRGRGSTRIDVRASGSSVLSEPDTQEQYGAADAAKRAGRRDAPPDWVLEARAAAEKGQAPAQGAVAICSSPSGRASPLQGRGSSRIGVRASNSSVLSEPDTQEQYGAADAAKRAGRRDAPPDWVLEARQGAASAGVPSTSSTTPGSGGKAAAPLTSISSGVGPHAPRAGSAPVRGPRASSGSDLSEPDLQGSYEHGGKARKVTDAPPAWVLEARAGMAAPEATPAPPGAASARSVGGPGQQQGIANRTSGTGPRAALRGPTSSATTLLTSGSTLSEPDASERYGAGGEADAVADAPPAWVLEARRETAAGAGPASGTRYTQRHSISTAQRRPGGPSSTRLVAGLSPKNSISTLSEPDAHERYEPEDSADARDGPPSWVLAERAGPDSTPKSAGAPAVRRRGAVQKVGVPLAAAQQLPDGPSSASLVAGLSPMDSIGTLSEPDAHERYEAEDSADARDRPPSWVLAERAGPDSTATAAGASARKRGAVQKVGVPLAAAQQVLGGPASTSLAAGLSPMGSIGTLSEPDAHERYDPGDGAGARDGPPSWVLEARAAQGPKSKGGAAPAGALKGTASKPGSGLLAAQPRRPGAPSSARLVACLSPTDSVGTLSEPDEHQQYEDGGGKARDDPPDWVLEARAAAKQGQAPAAGARGATAAGKGASGSAGPRSRSASGPGSSRLGPGTNGSSGLSDPGMQEVYGAAEEAYGGAGRDARPERGAAAGRAAPPADGPHHLPRPSPSSAPATAVAAAVGPGREPSRSPGSSGTQASVPVHRAAGPLGHHGSVSTLSTPDTKATHDVSDAAQARSRDASPSAKTLAARSTARKSPAKVAPSPLQARDGGAGTTQLAAKLGSSTQSEADMGGKSNAAVTPAPASSGPASSRLQRLVMALNSDTLVGSPASPRSDSLNPDQVTALPSPSSPAPAKTPTRPATPAAVSRAASMQRGQSRAVEGSGTARAESPSQTHGSARTATVLTTGTPADGGLKARVGGAQRTDLTRRPSATGLVRRMGGAAATTAQQAQPPTAARSSAANQLSRAASSGSELSQPDMQETYGGSAPSSDGPPTWVLEATGQLGAAQAAGNPPPVVAVVGAAHVANQDAAAAGALLRAQHSKAGGGGGGLHPSKSQLSGAGQGAAPAAAAKPAGDDPTRQQSAQPDWIIDTSSLIGVASPARTVRPAAEPPAGGPSDSGQGSLTATGGSLSRTANTWSSGASQVATGQLAFTGTLRTTASQPDPPAAALGSTSRIGVARTLSSSGSASPNHSRSRSVSRIPSPLASPRSSTIEAGGSVEHRRSSEIAISRSATSLQHSRSMPSAPARTGSARSAVGRGEEAAERGRPLDQAPRAVATLSGRSSRIPSPLASPRSPTAVAAPAVSPLPAAAHGAAVPASDVSGQASSIMHRSSFPETDASQPKLAPRAAMSSASGSEEQLSPIRLGEAHQPPTKRASMSGAHTPGGRAAGRGDLDTADGRAAARTSSRSPVRVGTPGRAAQPVSNTTAAARAAAAAAAAAPVAAAVAAAAARAPLRSRSSTGRTTASDDGSRSDHTGPIATVTADLASPRSKLLPVPLSPSGRSPASSPAASGAEVLAAAAASLRPAPTPAPREPATMPQPSSLGEMHVWRQLSSRHRTSRFAGADHAGDASEDGGPTSPTGTVSFPSGAAATATGTHVALAGAATAAADRPGSPVPAANTVSGKSPRVSAEGRGVAAAAAVGPERRPRSAPGSTPAGHEAATSGRGPTTTGSPQADFGTPAGAEQQATATASSGPVSPRLQRLVAALASDTLVCTPASGPNSPDHSQPLTTTLATTPVMLPTSPGAPEDTASRTASLQQGKDRAAAAQVPTPSAVTSATRESDTARSMAAFELALEAATRSLAVAERAQLRLSAALPSSAPASISPAPPAAGAPGSATPPPPLARAAAAAPLAASPRSGLEGEASAAELQAQGKVRSAQDGVATLLRHTALLLSEADLQRRQQEAQQQANDPPTHSAADAATTPRGPPSSAASNATASPLKVMASRVAGLQAAVDACLRQNQDLASRLEAAVNASAGPTSPASAPTSSTAPAVTSTARVSSPAATRLPAEASRADAVVDVRPADAAGRGQLAASRARLTSLAQKVFSAAGQTMGEVEAALKEVGTAQVELATGRHGRAPDAPRPAAAGASASPGSGPADRPRTPSGPLLQSREATQDGAASSVTDWPAEGREGRALGSQAGSVASAALTPQRSTRHSSAGISKRTFRFGDFQCKALRNGDVYKGRRVGAYRDGYGVYVFANGDVYEGQFKTDRMEGHGVYSFRREGRYEGQWRSAAYHGTGQETFARGSLYTGEYQLGLRSGWGTCRFFNGDYFEGQWLGGMRHGWGMQQCSDDSNYVGEYARGKRHGLGVYTFPNGDRFAGQYVDDLPHGVGVYLFSSGQYYEGEWSEGRKHGWCTYRMEDGTCWAAHWVHGKPAWVEAWEVVFRTGRPSRASTAAAGALSGARMALLAPLRAVMDGGDLQECSSTLARVTRSALAALEAGRTELGAGPGAPAPPAPPSDSGAEGATSPTGWGASPHVGDLPPDVQLACVEVASHAAKQAAKRAKDRAAEHWQSDGHVQARLRAAREAAEGSAATAQGARRTAIEIAAQLDLALSMAQQAAALDDSQPEAAAMQQRLHQQLEYLSQLHAVGSERAREASGEAQQDAA